MTFRLTAVCAEAIWCQGTLLVAMSDGTQREYRLWGEPKRLTVWCSKDPCDRFLHMTHEQIVERCRDLNEMHRITVRDNLHMDKVRRFGQDYAKRGY